MARIPSQRLAFHRGLIAVAAVSALMFSGASGAVAAEPSGTPASGTDSHTWLDALDAGESLLAGEELESPNGAYRFAMQVDGNAVVYDASGRPLWNSGTFGAGFHLDMQADGNLVVYTAQGAPRWFSGTTGEPDSYLLLQDDGNLVVYRADESPSWASSVNGRIAPPPIDDLFWGETLAPGRELTSPNGRYRAVMQADGNFVFYGPQGAIWSTGTTGSGNRLDMQRDGNAVVYSPTGAVKWASATSASISRLVVTDGGDLQVQGQNSATLWSAKAQLTRDVLRAAERLMSGEQLTSANRQYRAVMQADGNFVVYSSGGPIWSSGTSAPASILELSDVGQLRIQSFWPYKLQWQATSFASARNAYVLMQDDGNLVEYDGRGGVIWSSRFGEVPRGTIGWF